MPPKKRTRATEATKTAAKEARPKPSRKKARKSDSGGSLADGEEQNSAVDVESFIHSTAEGLQMDKDSSISLKMLLSNTENMLVLSSMDKIAEFHNSVVVNTNNELVEGSVEKYVDLIGSVDGLVRTVTYMGVLLQRYASSRDNLPISTTLLVSNNVIESINLKSNDHLQISTVFVPLSNYHTVSVSGKLSLFMAHLCKFITEISKISSTKQNQFLFLDSPPVPFPIVGIVKKQAVRSAANDELLKKSKALFYNYLSGSAAKASYKAGAAASAASAPQDDSTKTYIEITRKQVQEARRVISNSRPSEALKQSFDVSNELISQSRDFSASKISEIKLKSNTNILVEDSKKNSQFKTVTIVGLPQANLTAFAMICSVLKI